MVDQHEAMLARIIPREITQNRWKLFLVFDFGPSELAYGEVSNALFALDSGISTEKIAVPPLSTLATAFEIAQIGRRGPNFPGRFIFSNTAPRGGIEGIPWQGDDARQRPLLAILKNGTPVLAISTGYTWSFVKDFIANGEDGQPLFFDLSESPGAYQFHSRDQYPYFVKRILDRDPSIVGKRLDPAQIIDYPRGHLMYTDGQGNMKLSTSKSEFDPKLRDKPTLIVTSSYMNNDMRIVTVTHRVTNGLSGPVEDRGLILRPGSSGDKEDPFLEIQLVGGSAYAAFGSPRFVDGHNPISFSPDRFPYNVFPWLPRRVTLYLGHP